MKWTDVIYMLSKRIGREEARKNFTDPLLVTFFSVFSRLYENHPRDTVDDGFPLVTEVLENVSSAPTQHSFGSPFVTIDRDSLSGELKIGSPVAASLDSIPTSPEPPRGNVLIRYENIKSLLTKFAVLQLLYRMSRTRPMSSLSSKRSSQKAWPSTHMSASAGSWASFI